MISPRVYRSRGTPYPSSKPWHSVSTPPPLGLLANKHGTATAALTAAGTWAAAAYLDAKLHLRKDIQGLTRLKKAEWDYQKRVEEDRVNCWYILDGRCRERWGERAIWFQVNTYTLPTMSLGEREYSKQGDVHLRAIADHVWQNLRENGSPTANSTPARSNTRTGCSAKASNPASSWACT